MASRADPSHLTCSREGEYAEDGGDGHVIAVGDQLVRVRDPVDVSIVQTVAL